MGKVKSKVTIGLPGKNLTTLVQIIFLCDAYFSNYPAVPELFTHPVYKQMLDTLMGLSPILADIVMQDLEEKAIMNIDIDFPIYYRYVDDIVLFTSVDKMNTILNTFNNIHNRLQFISYFYIL